MDGSDGRVDIRLLEENGSFGAFYRDQLNAEGTVLGLGADPRSCRGPSGRGPAPPHFAAGPAFLSIPPSAANPHCLVRALFTPFSWPSVS